MERLALCLLSIVLLSSSAIAQGPLELSVLFIGNSYSFYHDMPDMVANLAASAGRILDYDSNLRPGWTWELHWNSSPLTIEKIHSRVWDVVVLQEYSTRLAQDDDTICQDSNPFLDLLVREIRLGSPEAVIQFYQTWGRPYGLEDECPSNPYVCEYEVMQDRLTESYTDVACMYKPSQLAPAGEAFRRVKETVSEEAFYELYLTLGVEDHHPSEQGSYLVACTHFSTLFGLPCSGNAFISTLDPEKAEMLQRVADETISLGQWNFPQDDSCTNCVCQCAM